MEIKSGATVAEDWLNGLTKWCTLAGGDSEPAQIIYGGGESFEFKGVSIRAWDQMDK